MQDVGIRRSGIAALSPSSLAYQYVYLNRGKRFPDDCSTSNSAKRYSWKSFNDEPREPSSEGSKSRAMSHGFLIWINLLFT